jgi:hypothetical protein
MDAFDGEYRGLPSPFATAPGRAEGLQVGPDEFASAFGESLAQVLDPESWRSGQDLAELYARIDAEVGPAVRQEERVREPYRQHVFPRLADRAGAPKGAGVRPAELATIKRIHQGLLFNGGTEACDGTVRSHDTLPLTFFQVGVSLVSYRGDQGTWCQRLFRRDLRLSGGDPIEEALELLSRRTERPGLHQADLRDGLGELARRALMDYAERAILLRRSSAVWLIGHGAPATYSLLTGSGSMDLMIEATRMLEELILVRQKFLFVPSEPGQRQWLTLGQALRPLEYAIVERYSEQVARIVAGQHYAYHHQYSADTTIDGRRLTPPEWIGRFRDEVASNVVVGLYRASALAPAQLFYAHEDQADMAAHLAVADSLLQAHRGFPLLLDLAHQVCGVTFGPDSLTGPLQAAYAAAGVPFRYLSERATRER